MHFRTSADVIAVNKIDIEFIKKITGLGRRPIALKRGPLLQIRSTYTAYRQLCLEFDNILSSDHDLVQCTVQYYFQMHGTILRATYFSLTILYYSQHVVYTLFII